VNGFSLDAADAHRLLDATARLAATPPPDFTDVCSLLRELIPSASVSFNDMAIASGDFRYVLVPDVDIELAARLKPYYDRYFHQHPLITHAAGDPCAGALRFRDVPGGDDVTDTDLFRFFYEPFGIRYQMVLQLPAPPGVVVGYALNRGAVDGEFSDRDVSVLNALEAHLALHHRVVNDIVSSRAMSAEAQRDGWYALSVRSDGVIERSSATSRHPDLRAGATLPPTIVALLPKENDADRQPSHHDVSIASGQWRCVVHPVAAGPTVLLIREVGDESRDVTLLVESGLTPRQADVAIALARTGDSNPRLARRLGISEGTLKKHLESVFRVLRVESRAAAAVAVLAVIE
jgi:DNA-binding CsgD family transcriptional regulator